MEGGEAACSVERFCNRFTKCWNYFMDWTQRQPLPSFPGSFCVGGGAFRYCWGSSKTVFDDVDGLIISRIIPVSLTFFVPGVEVKLCPRTCRDSPSLGAAAADIAGSDD